MSGKGPGQTIDDAEIEALIRRAKQGDRAAQDRLFDRYRPRLHLQAERRLGQRPVGGMNASDVVQEALLKATQHIGEMERSSRPELESWLQRIMKNTLIEGVRGVTRKKRDAHLAVSLSDPDLPEPAAPGRTPSQSVARAQEWLRALRALAQLPEGQREAVWLRHVEELSLREIAARMGRTELAAASLIRRGLEGLRESLGQGPAAPAAPADACLDEAVARYLSAEDPRGFLARYEGPCAEALRAFLLATEELQRLSAAGRG